MSLGAEEFFAAEDDAARAPRPNGHDRAAPLLPPIHLADVARWRGREPAEIQFTIEDLAPTGMVTLMTSLGGSGKTLLLQMAGTAIAAGVGNYLGKGAVVGRAAGIFGEDPEGVLHVRQPRINEHLNIGYDAVAERYFPQSYFGLRAQLWRGGRVTPFFGELEQSLMQIQALRLVTLDNAAILFSGDENSRPEVTEFLSELNGLADRLDVAIILSAHASKTQDGTALRVTSGSTAWVNACRSVLELKAGDSASGPSLTVVKANHAATGTTIQLTWRDKLLIPEVAPTSIIRSSERHKAERVFLALLKKIKSEGRHVSESTTAGNFAPKLFARRGDNEGCKVDDFRTAMESLFQKNAIVVELVGRKGHQTSSIVSTEKGEIGGVGAL